MTEAEWTACDDPGPMLEFLRGKASTRKLRLFALACCYRVAFLLTEEDSQGRLAMEVAEQMEVARPPLEEINHLALGVDYASFRLIDGFRREPDLNARSYAIRAAYHCLQVCQGTHYEQPAERVFASFLGTGEMRLDIAPDLMKAAECARFAAGFATGGGGSESPEWLSAIRHEAVEQAALLRCIFGNPFRPVTIDPTLHRWNGGTIVHCAQTAYEERHLPSGELDRGKFSILADALEDAGCTNADILDHLRGPGPHVRGCWVVDLLVQKV